jgi:hypothetical protein
MAPVSYDNPDDGTPAQQQPEKSSDNDFMGEINRELETILGNQESNENSFPPENESQPLDTEIVAYPTYEDNPAAPATPTETTTPVFSRAAVETAAVPSFKTYSYDESAVYDHEPAAPAVDVDVTSIDDARRGVVWSEILSPCKALRGD